MIGDTSASSLITYQIRVHGRLSDTLLMAFPQLQARTSNGDTVLTGVLPDQSALHGVLSVIEDLGLELLEVRREGVNGGS